jgi:hypothetical protein
MRNVNERRSVDSLKGAIHAAGHHTGLPSITSVFLYIEASQLRLVQKSDVLAKNPDNPPIPRSTMVRLFTVVSVQQPGLMLSAHGSTPP